MTDQSRRDFLKRASAGAVAAAGAVAFGPGLIARSAPAVPLRTPAGGGHPDPVADGPVPSGPLLAYVRDPGKGEISILVGEHEVVYQDHGLAARLAAAGSRQH